MKYKVFGNRVLIRKLDDENKTESGLVLISEEVKTLRAEIVSVGIGEYDETGNRIDLGLDVGDVIVYGKCQMTPVKEKEETLYIINANDVLIKLKGETE